MSEASPPDGKSNYRDPNVSRAALRELLAADRACEEALGFRRNLLKRIKAGGDNTKAMRRAIRRSGMQVEEGVSETRDDIYYMTLRNMPMIQDSLFAFDTVVNERTKREDDVWEVQERGYKAGRIGVDIGECPYDPGTEFHVEWRAWWHKGQAAAVHILGPDTKPADASRKRPRQQRMPGTEHIQHRGDPDPIKNPDTAERGVARMARAANRKVSRKKAARKVARKAARKDNGRGPRTAEDGVTVY